VADGGAAASAHQQQERTGEPEQGLVAAPRWRLLRVLMAAQVVVPMLASNSCGHGEATAWQKQRGLHTHSSCTNLGKRR